jgi:hypothetical protein
MPMPVFPLAQKGSHFLALTQTLSTATLFSFAFHLILSLAFDYPFIIPTPETFFYWRFETHIIPIPETFFYWRFEFKFSK